MSTFSRFRGLHGDQARPWGAMLSVVEMGIGEGWGDIPLLAGGGEEGWGAVPGLGLAGVGWVWGNSRVLGLANLGESC